MAERRIVVQVDGEDVDVTVGVQVCYDLLCASMDWGSGFLDNDEVAYVRTLAAACGFEPIPYPRDVCAECQHQRSDHGTQYADGATVAEVCWKRPRDLRYGEQRPPDCPCPGFRLA